jgi:hypothetical protein
VTLAALYQADDIKLFIARAITCQGKYPITD